MFGMMMQDQWPSRTGKRAGDACLRPPAGLRVVVGSNLGTLGFGAAAIGADDWPLCFPRAGGAGRASRLAPLFEGERAKVGLAAASWALRSAGALPGPIKSLARHPAGPARSS